jgi:hypothetical protein
VSCFYRAEALRPGTVIVRIGVVDMVLDRETRIASSQDSRESVDSVQAIPYPMPRAGGPLRAGRSTSTFQGWTCTR